MYITNVTDYEELTLCNCANNDNNDNIEIIIPLFTIIPCDLSLICFISLRVYTIIKPLKRKEQNISNNFNFINMYWSCDNCDEVIYEEFRTNHLRSGYQKQLASSIIRKYSIVEPNGVGDTIAEFLKSH